MKTKRTLLIQLTFALIAGLVSCQETNKDEIVTIAFSRERKSEHLYSDWLKAQGYPFHAIILTGLSEQQVADTMAYCDALLLTGGADIYPGIYGKEADTTRCGFIDRERDAYETIAYKKAKEMQLPVLGICRGLQMINVLEGGTLYIDLPQDKGSGELHRVGAEDWSTHPVELQPASILAGFVNNNPYPVASNHHQGIDVLAPGLLAIAHSNDGLIEAITRADQQLPFMLAVQWHPEWVDYNDTLSAQIAEKFLQEAIKRKTLK